MEHWNIFWSANDTLYSATQSFDAVSFEDEIKTFWQQHSQNLTTDAVIVDLATGNGALPLLLNEEKKKQQAKWSIHGVDAADIHPTRLAEREPTLQGKFDGIEFHANTDLIKLPFDDASVDLVVSQFGFEYADEALALEEVFRVLKPNGRFVLLMHHKKSTLFKLHEVGIKVYTDVLQISPLFVQAELYLLLATEKLQHTDFTTFNNSPESTAIHITVQWITEQLKAKYQQETEERWFSELLNRVIRILASVKDLESAQDALRHIRIEHRLVLAHIQRMEDAQAAHKTETQVKKLIAAGKKYQAQGEHQALVKDDTFFAWQVQFTRDN